MEVIDEEKATAGPSLLRRMIRIYQLAIERRQPGLLFHAAEMSPTEMVFPDRAALNIYFSAVHGAVTDDDGLRTTVSEITGTWFH